MGVLEAVARAQLRAEQQMTDECLVRRKTGRVFNETTGQYDDTFSTIYEGKCKVQELPATSSQVLAGGRQAGVWPGLLCLPFQDSAEVAVDDDVLMTVSADPLLLAGKATTVRELHMGTQKSARRLPIEVVTA